MENNLVLDNHIKTKIVIICNLFMNQNKCIAMIVMLNKRKRNLDNKLYRYIKHSKNIKIMKKINKRIIIKIIPYFLR
jgi:hypothetical protein